MTNWGKYSWFDFESLNGRWNISNLDIYKNNITYIPGNKCI